MTLTAVLPTNMLWDQRNVDFNPVKINFSGKVVFENLDLEFPAGKTTAIVGPSGIGKSMLLYWVRTLVYRYVIGEVVKFAIECVFLSSGEDVARDGAKASADRITAQCIHVHCLSQYLFNQFAALLAPEQPVPDPVRSLKTQSSPATPDAAVEAVPLGRRRSRRARTESCYSDMGSFAI
ncbi:uncharacterized protein TRIVIDRAFT_61712 [Trichoderma virens Gv29-8]|uniref:ABC transporter domain-containing protein n=1 Tax=Hypocrea virens (strain Gv29-8 / FGSC 10586) TaxID=413071 RepID=G9ML68_HYPVG|nr:uncharacterized protein TRIVIDRAFT_61712 [Trichoderma virens Gv29-8]EHK24962.1 hypothetical protein TRIVIDRAFT_61712 [Trichoderma virens Gv29-8]UKZ55228.1 hypothetical protein TrVGV298_009047 [Trichoderma virens]